MIVGLTGTGLPFDRLVTALAEHARNTGDTVWVQHGSAALVPPLSGASLLPRSELLEKMRSADVIVTHAGCGSIADAFRVGHTPVIVPRRAMHGEHVNDHQLELAEVLSEEGRVVLAEDMGALSDAIGRARARARGTTGMEPGHNLRQALSREIERRQNDHSMRTGMVWSLFRMAAYLSKPRTSHVR